LNYYLDSSALIKLIFEETESSALHKTLRGNSYTSVIGRLEVRRAIERIDPKCEAFGLDRLNEFEMVALTETTLALAENFRGVPSLRSLDAIHIASAMSVRQEIGGLITYDKQMANAAMVLGLSVLSPM